MKVDEKMIEAGLKAYSSSGTHPVVTIRAIFTAMLAAAPTDYGELVEDAEWLRDIGEQELFVCDVEWQDRLYAIAERIELLSALSGVHSETT